jgi:ribonuclease P/MRP protein subunit RPP1
VATDTRVNPSDRQLHRDLTNGLAAVPAGVMDDVAEEARAHGVRPCLSRLTRLTVRFGEPGELQDILAKHDELVRRYDLLALEPTSERAFVSACNNKRVDIVTLPLGIRMPFRLRAPTLKAAAANGVALEVSYNAALMDTAARRNFFANAAALVRAVGSGAGGGVGAQTSSFAGTGVDGGGRHTSAPGIILSGGSRQAMELRGPYDAANLATLFGMKDEHARAAMSSRWGKPSTPEPKAYIHTSQTIDCNLLSLDS